MKKVGIVGCGSIAQVHAWVLQEMNEVEITAVCDVDLEKAEMLSKNYANGKAVYFADWKQMCTELVDVVHICTPHYLHVPMAVEFLQHGKSVFMEKPCAISREQFEELKQIDKKYPGKLGFCFQNRYNDTTLLLEKMIEEGLIGTLTGARAFVTWRRDEEYYGSSDWKGKWSTEGGGALINQAIHTLDLLIRFLGKPQKIEATTKNHHLKGCIEVEDTVEVWLAFEHEKRACFYASTGYATDAPIIFELQGEQGRITMNGSEISLYVLGKEPKHIYCEQDVGIGKGYWGCGHKACIEDFYKSLKSNERFQVDLHSVESTFDTVMRIYEQ